MCQTPNFLLSEIESRIQDNDKIEITNLNYDSIRWLLDNVGYFNINWFYRNINGYKTIYFKTEEDRVKFILRWL